jgi:hypothetical protein
MTYYENVAFPADTPLAVIQRFFCGNSRTDGKLQEKCDNGPNNFSSRSCCTPGCGYAKAGRNCGVRQGPCFTRPKCSNHGTCRPSVPEIGLKCQMAGGAKGACDERGSCVSDVSGRLRRRRSRRLARLARAAKFSRGKHVKNLLQKRNLKIRQKHKDFNLDEIETQTKFNNQLSSHKKLKRDQDVVDEIFDEDEISNDEENLDEDTDDKDQQDFDEQEFDE